MANEEIIKTLKDKATFYADEILKAKETLGNIEHDRQAKIININQLQGAHQAMCDLINELSKEAK